MGKVIYVNGSIIIKTRYFLPKEIGCGYRTPPCGAEIIEPNDIIDGIKCLVIDDDNPQSLFNEYYAKDGVSSGFIATSYLSASDIDNVKEYCKRISETCDIIQKVTDWDKGNKALIYKMSFVNILTALDAFICYTLLRRSTRDELLFTNLMNELCPQSKRNVWEQLKAKGYEGRWEQEAIRYVLETSFVNTSKIDRTIKKVHLESISYDKQKVEKYFRIRHLIVHRNGKQKDDNEISITYEMLSDLIISCHEIVGAIYDSICLTNKKEALLRPKPLPLDEVFPNGIVRMPFKLSDLSRLLNSNNPDNNITYIDMPCLPEIKE